MAQIYQDDGRYFDAHDVELFYNEGRDEFKFADGRVFNENLDDSIYQSDLGRNIGGNTSVNGRNNLNAPKKPEPAKINIGQGTESVAQVHHQAALKPPVQSNRVEHEPERMATTGAVSVNAELGGESVGEMGVKTPGVVKITAKALNYVLDRTWVTVVMAVILSWLSAFMAGVAVCFIFNNRVMKTWVRATCLTISVVSLVYTMSAGYSMERAYSSGDRGTTNELRFVLSINPGTTSLNALKNLVSDSGYASTYNQSNNSVTIRTGTLDCVVYLDLSRKTVNAVEVYGTRKYELSIYPYNVMLKTNYGLFVFNMLEVNVGALLNDLENPNTDIEAYLREIYPANN